MENIFLCVKDEDGELRPMAGIWRDNESGKIASETYQKKNPDVKIVRVEIKELNQ